MTDFKDLWFLSLSLCFSKNNKDNTETQTQVHLCAGDVHASEKTLQGKISRLIRK